MSRRIRSGSRDRPRRRKLNRWRHLRRREGDMMATQGLVTIRKDGRVAMKLITGCGGMNARALAASLRKGAEVPAVAKAYDMAIAHHFGEQSCLVVMSATE